MEVSSRIFGPAFQRTPHYALKRIAFVPTMSTPLEFDEKKFWIALFCIMVKRETSTVNAITESFTPSPSGGERYNYKTGIKKANPQSINSFL
jgi:hypothetical protein